MSRARSFFLVILLVLDDVDTAVVDEDVIVVIGLPEEEEEEVVFTEEAQGFCFFSAEFDHEEPRKNPDCEARLLRQVTLRTMASRVITMPPTIADKITINETVSTNYE